MVTPSQERLHTKRSFSPQIVTLKKKKKYSELCPELSLVECCSSTYCTIHTYTKRRTRTCTSTEKHTHRHTRRACPTASASGTRGVPQPGLCTLTTGPPRAPLAEDRAPPAGVEAQGQARAHLRALEGQAARLPYSLLPHTWLPGGGTQKTQPGCPEGRGYCRGKLFKSGRTLGLRHTLLSPSSY